MSRKVEDVISGTLKGDARKNALDLVQHVQAGEVPAEGVRSDLRGGFLVRGFPIAQ
jgi:hypothetical protein